MFVAARRPENGSFHPYISNILFSQVIDFRSSVKRFYFYVDSLCYHKVAKRKSRSIKAPPENGFKNQNTNCPNG